MPTESINIPNPIAEEYIESLPDEVHKDVERVQAMFKTTDFKELYGLAREFLADIAPWIVIERSIQEDPPALLSDCLKTVEDSLKDDVEREQNRWILSILVKSRKAEQEFVDNLGDTIVALKKDRDHYRMMQLFGFFVLSGVLKNYGLTMNDPETVWKAMERRGNVPTFCVFLVFARLMDEDSKQIFDSLSEYYRNRFIGLFVGIATLLVMGEEHWEEAELMRE